MSEARVSSGERDRLRPLRELQRSGSLSVTPAPDARPGLRQATTTHTLHALASVFSDQEPASGGGKRIRVCVVDTMLMTGGAEWFASQLAMMANPEIFEFVFLTFDSRDSLIAKRLMARGFRVICASSWRQGSFEYSEWLDEQLFELLERLNPDLVFFSSQYPFGEVPHDQLSRFTVIVRISNFHADELGTTDFSMASKVICCSDEQFSCVSARYPEKAVLIKTGVDTELFQAVAPAQKDELKRMYGLEGKTVVLFVGRLAFALKRVDVFQDVVRRIKALRTDVAFVVVGYFAPQDVALHDVTDEENFRSFVEAEGLLWKEDVPPWEVPSFYQMADILLSTSAEYEGLSNSVLQALASGVVPVVTASGGMHELVNPGETGFIVHESDATSIAHEVLEAADTDSATRLRLIENGRRKVKELFNLTQCAVEYQRTIMDVYRCQPAAICVTDGYFGVGGAEWLAAQLILNSDPREVQFQLVMHRADEPLPRWLGERGVVIHAAPPRMDYNTWRLQEVEDVYRMVRPDVVMPCTITSWPAHDPFYRLLIISQNASDAGVLLEQDYDQADYFICVSDEVKDQLSAKHQWKMMVLRNAIDVEMFSPRPESNSKVRHQLGIDAEAKVLLWCGRMHEPRKRLDVLMDVIAEMDSDPSVHFLVLGYFREDTGKDAWLQLMASHQNVSWVTGVVPWEMGQYYSAADVYLSTSGFERSDFEGLSVTSVQALAAQLPVVTTMSGGQREVVEHGRNGLLVEPGDVAGLVNALREILTSDAIQLEEIRERNRQKALEKFDIREHARVYSRVARLLKNTVGTALASDPDLPTPQYDFRDEAEVSTPEIRTASSFICYSWPLLRDRDGEARSSGTGNGDSSAFGLLKDLGGGIAGPILVATSSELAPYVPDWVPNDVVSRWIPGSDQNTTAVTSRAPYSLAIVAPDLEARATYEVFRDMESLLESGGWLIVRDLGPAHHPQEHGPNRYSAASICALLDYLELAFPLWSTCERYGPHLLLQKR